MTILIKSVHVASALLMIVLIMLQQGKGADFGASFGAGSSSFFGSRGSATFLSRVTAWCAVVFFLSSLWIVRLEAPAPKVEPPVEQSQAEVVELVDTLP